MSLSRIFKENSKKIMAVASALLMVTFLLPSLGKLGRGSPGSQTVATIFGNQKISALEAAALRQQWEIVRTRLGYTSPSPDDPSQQQTIPLAAILGAAVRAIDVNPDSFLVLIEEARHLGISVSNDQYQQLLRGNLQGMPDPSDPNYDAYTQAVYNLLLVRNLLDRVGNVLKFSQPRQRLSLAELDQDISVSVVQIPYAAYLPATTQPTAKQIQDQYNRFKNTLPGAVSADDPLGLGYCLPNRVKLQYIGFSQQQLRPQVIASQPDIDWRVQARRYYRTHTDEFPVSTMGPSTQPVTPPVWEKLPEDVAAKVYSKVYDLATATLAGKILNQLNQQIAVDWEAYQNAVSQKQKPPPSSLGPPYDSAQYLQKVADMIQQQFHVRLVVAMDDNGWKTAQDLSQMNWIGQTQNAEGQTFGQYATSAGAQFTSAAKLMESQQLALWAPSEPVYSGAAATPDDAFVFRLTAMDPSHPEALSAANDQVVQDLRTQQAWKAAMAAANTLADSARTIGLDAAADQANPPRPVSTTGLFNAASASDNIPGLHLQPASVPTFAHEAMSLLSQPAGNRKSVVVVQLPADGVAAAIQLNKVQANWTDAADQMALEAELSSQQQNELAQQLEESWSLYSVAAKRTDYKPVAGQN